jgi:hypothetical protein
MDPHVFTDLTQTMAASAAAFRLMRLNLGRQFPALLSYLLFLAGINLALGLMDDGSIVYFWTYLLIQPLKCILSVVAVRELFALTFQRYPGIRSMSQWVIFGVVGLSLAVSTAVTGVFWNGAATGRAHSHLFYFEVLVRTVVFSLAAAIIGNLLFLSKYPLHLSKNTLVSSAFFSAMFISQACGLLLDSLTPQLYNRYLDTLGEVFVIACLAGWAAMLKPEAAAAPPQIRFSSPQEDYLLQQLDSLNQLMTRSVRR